MLVREFSVKAIRPSTPGITPGKAYPVLGITGTLNDTAFFIADDNEKITFIKLGNAAFGGFDDTNIASDPNVERSLFIEQIEALGKKVASLQGQVSALKGKKAE